MEHPDARGQEARGLYGSARERDRRRDRRIRTRPCAHLGRLRFDVWRSSRRIHASARALRAADDIDGSESGELVRGQARKLPRGRLRAGPARRSLYHSPGGARMNDGQWTCYHDPSGTVTTGLKVDEIRDRLASGVGTLWVDVDLRDPAQVSMLTEVFRFHPLAVEDSLNPNSRVKFDEYKGFVILIVRTVAFVEHTEDPYDIETVNFTCFLGQNFLVTVHGEHTHPVDATVEVLRKRPELAAAGPARLMHAVVDEAVNAYFPIVDQIDEF